ncbi:MAG: hypothetical protein HYU77_13865 [Betaproteobacteria bacterium]|nr:hypothetical protein [Betaproteobacteria bacterium]
MAAILFDAQLVITRLGTLVPTTLKKVGGATDLPATEEAVARLAKEKLPAGYVLPLADRAGPNVTGTEVVEQMVETRFGVLLAVSNLRDPRGEQAQVDLRSVRQAVMDKLLGWPPAADYDPCEYAQGRLLQFSDQVLWWQEEYTTRLLERSI